MRPVLIASMILGLVAAADARAFTSGSDGSDGVIQVLSGTTSWPLPADGILRCTTVSVAQGATLKFTPNAQNTRVILLCTGDVSISGLIDVRGGPASGGGGGQAGPGGFDGGSAGDGGSVAPGDGQGPGGGAGGTCDFGGATAWGRGSFGCPLPPNPKPRDGVAYGNSALLDLVGGSGAGGCPNFGAAGGGGAILIASDTRIIVTGTIDAAGGDGSIASGGGGSGGAIRLVAPIVGGTGTIRVRGGNQGSGLEAGGGRSRVDALDRKQVAFFADPPCAFTQGSRLMIAIPAGLGRLAITSVAGQAISGDGQSAIVNVAPNASNNQTVVVRANDYAGIVPISVVLTPVHGPRTVVDAQIGMSGGNPSSVNVPVTLPADGPIRVDAWTR